MKRAFTLVELSIVVAVIALLAAIFTPWLTRRRPVPQPAPDQFELTVLFETNGIRAYRFYDKNEYHYFIDARGSTTSPHRVNDDYSNSAEVPTIK